MNKPSRTRYVIPALLLSTAVLAGCSFSASSRSSSSSSSDDDEKTTVVQPAAPNYPEQLLQLNEAHDKKLISDKDYQTQLQKINDAMKKQKP